MEILFGEDAINNSKVAHHHHHHHISSTSSHHHGHQLHDHHPPEKRLTHQPTPLPSECQTAEDFVTFLPVRFQLRHYPLLLSPGFCPTSALQRVACLLRYCHSSLASLTFKASLRRFLRLVRALVRWVRNRLHARNRNIRQICEFWVESEADERSALHKKMYKDSRMYCSRMKTNLEAYVKLSSTDVEKFHAVVDAYWQRRHKYRREFHVWYTALVRAQAEVRELSLLWCMPSVDVLAVSERLMFAQLERQRLQASAPKFAFDVHSVTIPELRHLLKRSRSVAYSFPLYTPVGSSARMSPPPLLLSTPSHLTSTPPSKPDLGSSVLPATGYARPAWVSPRGF